MAAKPSRIVKLDAAAVEALKPEGKRYRVTDAVCPRLKLVVETNGRKWWSARYVPPHGRESEMALGTFPVTLPDIARKKARALDHQKDMEDPAAEKRARREAAAAERTKVAAERANTFGAVSQAYLAASAKGLFSATSRPKATSTLAIERLVLNRHVLPVLGDRPFGEIGRRDIVALLENVATGSGNGASEACLKVIRRVFAYGRHKDLRDTNPAVEIRAMPSSPRDVVASDGALRRLWETLEEAKKDRTFKRAALKASEAYSTACALQLSLLTLQRRGEVVRLRKEDLDLEKGLWTIPAMNKKERRKGLVPLSPQAQQLLAAALERSGEADWVFPGVTDTKGGAGHVKPKTITRFLARLRTRDAERRAAALERAKIGAPLPGDTELLAAPALGDITPHDLRRTGRTKLTGEELQIDEATAERVLNHSVGSRQQNAYDWNAYLAAKRQALDSWANELMRIVEGRALPSNVVKLKRA